MPIDFGAEADEIAFSAAARNLPVVSADPYLNECLVSYWETALARRSNRQNSIRAAVENAILPLLPHGKARIGKVAEDLGVSSRTLSRRLSAEGVTFAQVFDEMRADLAEGYLSDRSLSITHIAWLLGFQEASAFTHAYKRWKVSRRLIGDAGLASSSHRNTGSVCCRVAGAKKPRLPPCVHATPRARSAVSARNRKRVAWSSS